MKNKNYLWSLLAIVASGLLCIGFSACGDDVDDDPELKVTPSSIKFAATDPESVTFEIECNTKWSISIDEDWLEVSSYSGKNDETIEVTAEENKGGEKRTANITIYAENLERKVKVTQEADEQKGISVTPTTPSLLGEKGSSATLSVVATGNWTLSGCPDWLHSSATNGVGNTNIILTALSANDMSDEPRKATLTFSSNETSAIVSVSQESTLPSGLRVETSNMTIMSDGFACDLKFGPNTKGYREAFFTEDAVQTMTDRDIYNKLMETTEYSGSIDYTFLPDWAGPGSNLVYCVAAYGNESNSDGSHKYGPITIERITTRSQTVYDDMYLTSSYNSSRWTVTAARQGNYGQRCDEFYYVAAEDELADEYYFYASRVTYALLAHLIFKPRIIADRNWNYCNGPQTMNWSRSGDKFFCSTWGIDRDTKEFSAELSCIYRDLSESAASEMTRMCSDPSDWNKPFRRPTLTEINKMRNSIRIIKVSK